MAAADLSTLRRFIRLASGLVVQRRLGREGESIQGVTEARAARARGYGDWPLDGPSCQVNSWPWSDANPRWLHDLTVTVDPNFYDKSEEIVEVRIFAYRNDHLPLMTFTVPNFGTKAVKIDEAEIVKDETHRTITIKAPVVIQKFPELAAGIARTGGQ